MKNTYMFDNWQNLREDYVPNNTILLGPPPDGVRNIIRNTTPEHFLRVPFNMLKDVQEMVITYKQDDIYEVHKTLEDITIYEENPFVVYFQFTEAETGSFKAIPNTPVKIQIKAKLANGDVVASDICMIRVLDVLSDDLFVEEESE